MEIRGINLWMVMIANGFFWVSLDLMTTTIGLARGFVEMNCYGNIPMLYYFWSISMISLIYLIYPLRIEKSNNKTLHLAHLAALLLVSSLPVTAVIHNLIVLSG